MIKKILNIGPVSQDLIVTPDDQYIQSGGAVYYQSHTLYALNYPHDVVLTIAEDDMEILDDFPSKKNLILQNIKNTMQYTNIYDEDNNRTQKAIIEDNPIKIETLNNLNLDDYHYVILSPLSKYDITPDMLVFLKNNNLTVVLAAQGFMRTLDSDNNIIKTTWNNKDSFLKNTDIIILDDQETKEAFNLDKITDKHITNIIKKYNLKIFIITMAEKGSIIYTQFSKYTIPAKKTNNIIDPTGLGDTYIASFIGHLNETGEIKKSGLFASYITSEKIQVKGPIKKKVNI